jgi:PucR C-terminal helix-turn-helix domain/GGDEF-like domain
LERGNFPRFSEQLTAVGLPIGNPARAFAGDNPTAHLRLGETSLAPLIPPTVPIMNSASVQPQVAKVAETIHAHTDELAVDLARSINRDVPLYRDAGVVSFDVLRASCAANLDPIFGSIAADTDFDTEAARKVGAERADERVPLASVMEAYRVGFRAVWGAVMSESARLTTVTADTVRALTLKVSSAQQLYTEAMAAGYRDEQIRLLRGDQSERSILIDSLLHGRLIERWSMWEAADCLGLPTTGPYLVIAADIDVPGVEPLPDVESKLRSLDVPSAWRPLPDLYVGILHFRNDKHFGDALALLSRMATARIGVSARFNDLRDTAEALRYARVMLRGRADAGALVSVFDGSILASAAVSAPEVLVKLVTPTIECFAGLSDQERDVLFETFRVWVDNDGSMYTAGELLFCHPNTVRYRLHRIERRTGRSLSNPRDLAELCLAFEVQRRLM